MNNKIIILVKYKILKLSKTKLFQNIFRQKEFMIKLRIKKGIYSFLLKINILMNTKKIKSIRMKV